MKKSFVAAIVEYDDNRTLLEEKGRKARIRIEEQFSWDYNVEAMQNIYHDILERRG